MEVEAGVHRIQAPLGSRAMYMHVLVGPDGVVMVDTGVASTPDDVLFPHLASIGIGLRDIRTAVITHADADHSGGNASLKAANPAAKIICHPLDKALIEDPERMIAERYGELKADGVGYPPEVIMGFRNMLGEACPVDEVVEEGAAISVGDGRRFEVVHTPGHSAGHIILFDRERRLAVATDAVLGEGLPDNEGNIIFPPTYRLTKEYLDTIAIIERLEPATLLLTHFPILRGDDVGEFLRASRAFVDRLEQAIVDELSDRPRTFPELMNAIDARIRNWPPDGTINLKYALIGGLEVLEAKGQANRSVREGRSTWTKA